MRFKVYVRDGELCQAFEYFFSLFQKYLVFVQRAQTHVVLSKRNKSVQPSKESTSNWMKRTSIDLHPPSVTALVLSSTSVPQQYAMKPGNWNDSMR